MSTPTKTIADCFGRPSASMKCKKCQYKKSCREYARPEPKGHPLEYRDDIMAVADRADRQEVEPGGRGNAAEIIARLSVIVSEAASGSPTRIGVVFARLAGLSLSEIGSRMRISKQGIHKHIMEVARVNPAIGKLLMSRPATCGTAEVVRQRSVEKLNQATRRNRA